MAALWTSTILIFLVRRATSEFLSDVCKIPDKSYGAIPPPLPTNFELKGEHVDNLNNVTRYMELYFDYDNSRAKYMYLMNGVQHHYLFDYDTQQIVEWDILHPGVSVKRDPLSHVCTAVEMEDAPQRNIFGYRVAPGILKAKMYSSNQVLRYGGQYLYAANDTEKLANRGIQCNRFVGCLYDRSVDATMYNTYWFSADKVEPSGATTKEEVLGPETGYLSVPVKLQVTGFYPNETGDYVQLNVTVSVSWFKGNPKFPTGAFQMPPWIHCKNYRGRKDIPKFPTAFSTRVAITQMQVDILGEMTVTESESFEQIYYYAAKNLARRDFTPITYLDKEIANKFPENSSLSAVYDFNTGLRYTIHKSSGRCYIGPILRDEFFNTEKHLLDIRLAPPEEIFLMQMDDMEYKGKTFTRDIECDVWNGRHLHKSSNFTLTKETYISTNGWHAGVEDMQKYGFPVKHMVINTELDGDLSEHVTAYNFLKFKAKVPSVGKFDIRNCVEMITHKQFAIKLSNRTNTDVVFQYKYQFYETAQYYIADMAQVFTPLRVQRIYLRQRSTNDRTLFLVFTLLDKADLSDYSIPISQKGASLNEAIDNLQKVVDGGRFSIQFFPPGSKNPYPVNANAGDMYQVLPGGNLTLAPLNKMIQVPENTPEDIAQTEANPIVVLREEEIDAVDEKGMTPGHLALLAISMLFIGVGIGIAAMYLYVRMYGDRHAEDRLHMTAKKSELEANLETIEESTE